MKKILFLSLLAFIAAGCGSDSSPAADVEDTAIHDSAADTAMPDIGAEDSGTDVEETAGSDVIQADTTEPEPQLPFEFKRKAKGDAIPDEEITAFTKTVTAMWKKVDWFRWVLRTSTGVDPSTGKRDYLSWHNDVRAVKAGDLVTFKQKGGEHNMWIPSSKVLSEALNGCVLTGDWTICKVAEQYCKGLSATVVGFRWGEDDPAPYLMARAIFPMDQDFTLDEEVWKDDGRRKVVEFSHAYVVEDNWNAHSFQWPNNPAYGSIWVTNMRSKDDVCAISRTTAFLPYAVENAPYDWVKDACQETLDIMIGFHKDIVDHDYNIRTKDPDGSARLVTEQDLGSYMTYISIDERNECAARIAADYISYGEQKTNDCGDAFGTIFDQYSTSVHYYNYPIVWNYHMAAIATAINSKDYEVAKELLGGLAKRMDTYLSPTTKEPGAEHQDWGKDMAVLLVQAAAVGLPLNNNEARHIQKYWSFAVGELAAWDKWDLWAASVPDGEYNVRPGASPEGIDVEAVTMFLEYCNSPYKNPSSARFVDCDVVRDVANW